MAHQIAKKLFAAAVFISSAALGGGCSSEDSKATGAETCSALPPLASKATYRVGLAQIWEDDSNPWRKANTRSFAEEASKRGFTLVFDPGTRSSAPDQVERMQALIDAKVDAIFLAAHDQVVLAPTVVAARRACIPVFLEDRAVDTKVAIPGVDYVSSLSSDFRLEGEMAAEWFVAHVPGPQVVIELEGTVGSSPALLRKQGFDERVAKESRIRIVVSESADFNRATGHSAAARLLKAHPDATTLFAHNDEMAMGAIKAIEEAGKVPGKDIIVLSIDGTKEATQAVIDGKLAVVVECNPHFGPLAMSTLVDYAAKKPIPLTLKNTDRVFDKTTAAAYLPEAY